MALPFPFPFPMGPGEQGQPGDMSLPLLVPEGGMIGGGPNAGGASVAEAESVQESIERMPDGTICRVTIVTENGGAPKQTKTCEQPAQARRRLQQQPFGLTVPVAPMEDPMDEVWVLGGVVLQNLFTCFDFDGQRIGFAEPTGEPIAAKPLDSISQLQVSSTSKLAETAFKRPGRSAAAVTRASSSSMLAGGALAFAAVAGLAAAVGTWRSRSRRSSSHMGPDSHLELGSATDSDVLLE
eukprot:TRINITY_DN17352_c0_g1_i1.p1 TRINITY_DN17352_c0_g1~~TRINITY_DN17352_c0_g1_i1.p1  ORF type:complete len:239 (+),score=33.93 TRINITY_DN17352_c0_g1_i1:134-850(+)